MGERQCWDTGYAGRWWEAEGVLEKVGETEKNVSKKKRAGEGGVMFEECERDVGKTDIERLASNDILESVQCKRSHAIGTAQRLYKEKYIIINLMIQTLKHI